MYLHRFYCFLKERIRDKSAFSKHFIKDFQLLKWFYKLSYFSITLLSDTARDKTSCLQSAALVCPSVVTCMYYNVVGLVPTNSQKTSFPRCPFAAVYLQNKSVNLVKFLNEKRLIVFLGTNTMTTIAIFLNKVKIQLQKKYEKRKTYGWTESIKQHA